MSDEDIRRIVREELAALVSGAARVSKRRRRPPSPPLAEAIATWEPVVARLDPCCSVTTWNVAEAGGVEGQPDLRTTIAIGYALRRAGWVPRQSGSGDRLRVYRHPGAELSPARADGPPLGSPWPPGHPMHGATGTLVSEEEAARLEAADAAEDAPRPRRAR